MVVFSGGGTRFAIYCGMYAALEDLGHRPDLIIGACGGAVATGIINSFQTNDERKNYLKSEELYLFVKSTKLTKERKLHRIALLCLNKIVNRQKAPYIEDVFNRYLVDMSQNISTQLPSLASEMGTNVKSVIIGAKMLFDKTVINHQRADQKLYSKVLFTDSSTACNIDIEDIQIKGLDYTSGAVSSHTEIITNVPMPMAMRISLSDMFYVQPIYYQGNYFSGGAIDLMPIELAKSMAKYTILEKKSPYSIVEEALVRAVLGYSGNNRLHDVETQGASKWIDTQKATDVLNGHYCKKYIDWLGMQIAITLPYSHQQYVKDVDALWNYGYERILNSEL